MAFVIEPSEGENGAGGGGQRRPPRPDVRKGKKLVWAAGCNWGVSKAGNVKISTRFVVVADPDQTDKMSDVRGYVWETFTLTQSAAWKLQSMARAVGQKEPWDAEKEEETNSIIGLAPVWVNIQHEEGSDGVVRPRIDGSFQSFAEDISESMEAVVAEAEQHHDSSKQMQQSGRTSAPTPPPMAVVTDDEIPF